MDARTNGPVYCEHCGRQVPDGAPDRFCGALHAYLYDEERERARVASRAWRDNEYRAGRSH